jgi:hypothetical protein
MQQEIALQTLPGEGACWDWRKSHVSRLLLTSPEKTASD